MFFRGTALVVDCSYLGLDLCDMGARILDETNLVGLLGTAGSDIGGEES
jgi:hypothetical protein